MTEIKEISMNLELEKSFKIHVFIYFFILFIFF